MRTPNFSMLALALTASMAPTVPLPSVHPSRPSRRRSRGPAPINWATFRPMLAAMIEARDSALVIGEATALATPEAPPHAGSILALRASAEYILELTRCLAERPQGKGGWQRVAKLDGLLARLEAERDELIAGQGALPFGEPKGEDDGHEPDTSAVELDAENDD